jgi:hypothetical protein
MAIPTYLPQQAAIKACYLLEDVTDESAGSHDLTNSGGVTFTAAKFDNGANLGTPNTTKSLTISDNLDIEGGACSISIWIKLLSEIGTGIWSIVWQSGGTNDVGNWMSYEYNGGTRRLSFERRRESVSNDNFQHNVTLGTSDFYNLIYTYDGSDVIGYLNGVNVGTVASSGNGAGLSNNFRIGSEAFAGATITETLNDLCVVWNVCLTPSEVTSVYSGWQPKVSGFSGLSPWIFMKEAWEKHNKLWKPKGILVPEGI